jgi:glycosyltransferase involved in cell wall biosynthesis
MRITFVLPDANMGGGTRVIATHADRLRRRGHNVVVVATPSEVPPLIRKVKALVKGYGWPRIRAIGPSYFDSLKEVDLRRIESVRPITDDDVPDADVVVATWWRTAEWVHGFSPSKGAKAYFIQGYETFQERADRLKATWSLPLHKIVVSQWLVDIARDEYGDEDVSLVPNSVDLGQFHAPPRGRQPVPAVGLVYSQHPIKGCDVSLRAFELAQGKVAGLRLIAFGNERPSPHLPLPPASVYTFAPPQERIRDIYASCDAWLFGSRAEGFGLPVLEAMACRTPVIATPAGAAPQLLAGRGGILVPGEDPQAMADAIERVCTTPDAQWREMSDAALRTATGYTWDDAAVRFEAALRTAIERADGRAVTTLRGGGGESPMNVPAAATGPTGT